MADSDARAADLDAQGETIRQLRREINELRQRNTGDEPIAVVGSACRLPGGVNTPEELWQLLRAGRDTVRPLQGGRWSGIDFGGWEDAAFARIPRHAALVDDVEGFDAEFFGISPDEAAQMDPQQRLVLENVWEAAERAGWTPQEMRQKPTGIFVGVGHQDYLMSSLAAGDTINSRVVTGTARSLIANRVSYEFGLKGPSIAIDTACSSSLVALHLACQSLRTRECSRAFAGGVSLILSPLSMALTGRALPMAPDGRCKAFAADADGMIRGEGSGILALKRLSDAVADNDPIEAVILASATNQDGRTNGLTAPSPVAQTLLLDTVLKTSGLTPSDVTFVEMHGTGTPLGDPIEYGAVREVYGAAAEDPTCWLGSVKANLGHLEFAAGVASVLKTVGALKHGSIPPQINISRLNPRIDLEGQRFALADRETPWVQPDRRFAAVSSFGFGGTNAHIILAHPDAVPGASVAGVRRDPPPDRAVVMPLSARSPEALRAQITRTADALHGATAGQVQQALGTASRRRAHHPVRISVIARSPEELPGALRAAAARTSSSPAGRQRLAFVYSGQSGQWPGMGIGLAEQDAVAGDELRLWDEALTRAGGPPLIETLRGPGAARALADTRFAQVAIVAVQMAVTARLTAWGLLPAAVAGHSVGEVAAAVTAGALDRREAMEVLRARAEALHWHAGRGAMLAVRATAEDVQELLDARSAADDRFTQVGIGAFNAPGMVVLSGPEDVLHDLRPDLSAWRSTPLDTAYAFHSPGLGPAADEIGLALTGLRPHPTEIPLYSTTTGDLLPGQDLTAAHWAANAAQPVLFTQAVQNMLAQGVTAFVEIGPHPALTTHLRRAARAHEVHGPAVATLRRQENEPFALWQAAGELWAAGCEVNWEALHPGAVQTSDLPTYPWQRRRHWIPGAPATKRPAGAPETAAAEVPRECSTPSAAASSTPTRVLELLLQHVAEAMDVEPSALSEDEPTRNYDVDSVVFVELKSRLENELGTAIPLTALTEGASLREIARRIAVPERQVTTAHQAQAALDHIDNLSEAEVAQLLTALENREEW